MVAPTIAKAFDVEFPALGRSGAYLESLSQGRRKLNHTRHNSLPFRPPFIGKGRIGSHGRSISRNGLVLLMSRSSVAELELENARVRVRLAIWHRSHLRGERAKPWGILLCANILEASCGSGQLGDFMRPVVAGGPMAEAALSIDLGGERTLNFLAPGSNPRSDILFGKQPGNNRGC